MLSSLANGNMLEQAWPGVLKLSLAAWQMGICSFSSSKSNPGKTEERERFIGIRETCLFRLEQEDTGWGPLVNPETIKHSSLFALCLLICNCKHKRKSNACKKHDIIVLWTGDNTYIQSGLVLEDNATSCTPHKFNQQQNSVISLLYKTASHNHHLIPHC